MAAVVVPALILGFDFGGASWSFRSVVGASLVVAGFALWVWTVRLFAEIGRGTLAPWDPTTELVVAGPYRYVRNPMISAVLVVLVGEALLFGSWALAVYAAAFLAVNAVWFPLVEEPGLRKRFGPAYEEYARQVPRWVPRLSRYPRSAGRRERAG
jgi:protein-S-isoprenylcysteine O-methyltransferase Ste14